MAFLRLTLHAACRVALVFAAISLCGRSAIAQSSITIPDDWFFEGANRPKGLKDLEGKPAPELLTQAWIGDETTLQASRGKVVVLDFWATWCGPCMAAIPENVELVKKSKDRPLVFLGIHDSNSGWDKAPQVVKDKGINYPVAQDKGGSAKNYQLQFWPTYVVIDHEGIVRAAGLIPTHVAEVVEMLLAKVPATASGGTGNPAAWYFGGDARPTWLKQCEGKPAPALPKDAEWQGEALTEAARKDHVVVLHFLSPSSDVGMKQLTEIAALAPEFGPQGVSIVGICDARVDWGAAKAALDAKQIKVPVMRDAAAPPAANGKKGIEFGATAAAIGLRLAPSTIVIDRNGNIRAAGVRPDKIKDIINKLLAEPLAADAG